MTTLCKLPKNVETDRSIAVDVGMVDARGERKLGRLEWIIGGEVDIEEEHATLERTVRRAENSGLPVKRVVT